jgi:hypothetical protein
MGLVNPTYAVMIESSGLSMQLMVRVGDWGEIEIFFTSCCWQLTSIMLKKINKIR